MAIVSGNDVLLFFNDPISMGEDGVLLAPFACSRSITVNMNTDTIGKSTIGSGDWKEYEPVALGWDFTMEGIMYLDMFGSVTVPDIFQVWKHKTVVNIAFFINDVSGNSLKCTGNALITGVSPTGSVNNVSSINITGQGTGELIISTPLLRIINIQADVPSAGQITLTFDFDEIEGATGYTIQITDLSDNSTTTDTGGAAPRDIVINSGIYSFRLKAEPTGSYGLPTYYP